MLQMTQVFDDATARITSLMGSMDAVLLSLDHDSVVGVYQQGKSFFCCGLVKQAYVQWAASLMVLALAWVALQCALSVLQRLDTLSGRLNGLLAGGSQAHTHAWPRCTATRAAASRSVCGRLVLSPPSCHQTCRVCCCRLMLPLLLLHLPTESCCRFRRYRSGDYGSEPGRRPILGLPPHKPLQATDSAGSETVAVISLGGALMGKPKVEQAGDGGEVSWQQVRGPA
jgi:hypothetical protein